MVVELIWVLERAYGVSRERIATILQELVATEGLVVETSDDVALGRVSLSSGWPGFSDMMILAAAERSGARPLHTFDRKVARMEGVELPR